MVLQGRVIKILDEYRVVVDLGYEQGVTKDMKFFIYSQGEEIRDPETDEVIDRIEIVKHKLKVNHIQERISIMQSDEYEYIYPTFFTYKSAFEPASKNIPFYTDTQPQKSSEDDYKKIKVGDLVKQCID
jgi:hypothetical protein